MIEFRELNYSVFIRQFSFEVDLTVEVFETRLKLWTLKISPVFDDLYKIRSLRKKICHIYRVLTKLNKQNQILRMAHPLYSL